MLDLSDAKHDKEVYIVLSEVLEDVPVECSIKLAGNIRREDDEHTSNCVVIDVSFRLDFEESTKDADDIINLSSEMASAFEQVLNIESQNIFDKVIYYLKQKYKGSVSHVMLEASGMCKDYDRNHLDGEEPILEGKSQDIDTDLQQRPTEGESSRKRTDDEA